MMAVMSVALIAGCGQSGEKQAESESETVQTAEIAATPAAATGETMEVEIACAGCIYGMDGIEHCMAAVKIGDEIAILEGVEIDAHATGLCSAPKQAMVIGEIKDGKFVAAMVEVQ